MINILPGGLGIDAAASTVFSAFNPASLGGAGTATLSNNNRTFTGNIPGNQISTIVGTKKGTQGSNAHWYFEVTNNVLSSSGLQQNIGITGWVTGGAPQPGVSSNSIAATMEGTPGPGPPFTWSSFNNNVIQFSWTGTAAAGDVIGVAAFFATTGQSSVWLRLNGVWLNAGAPSTTFNASTPDLVISGVAQLYPGVSVELGQVTLNVGNAAFQNPPPSGYVAWG